MNVAMENQFATKGIVMSEMTLRSPNELDETTRRLLPGSGYYETEDILVVADSFTEFALGLTSPRR